MSKSVPKLQSSSQYDMFVQSSFNRDLHDLDPLVKSMKQHGFLPAYPLHCIRNGSKLIIKAGHHRFEAAKKLGIPVYYVVSEDCAEITKLEHATKSWSFNDYIKSFERSGSEHHIAILDYNRRTGISLGQCASLLGGECASSQNMQEKVRLGTFEVKQNPHAEVVATVVIGLKDIGVPFASNAQMVAAISSVCWLKEFDHKKFLHRAATNLHMFVKQATKMQFLDLIDRVYNHQARERIALAFLAKEAAKCRNAINKRKTV